MTTMLPLITADLARAARALAQVSLADVAARAELDVERLRRFERGRRGIGAAESHRLRVALEEFGVEFLSETDVSGYGVRQKFTSRKVKRLETWENEGGPAYEDVI